MYCMTETQTDICPVCGKSRSDYEPQMHHIPPGTMLGGKYVVGRVLGEGGFGITYLGKDTALDMKVAIKEYFPRSTASRSSDNMTVKSRNMEETSFEHGRERFLKEARTIAKMSKQTVFVNVTDFVQENNTAYIVMEYIEGTTLSTLVKQHGRMPENELFTLIEPLFDALSKFHETGLIHRDISPDNIMIEEGTVRLLDFGCAKDVSNQSETMTVTVKRGYAPIEQYSSSSQQGPWTDIYALGATIFFCLTGRAPKHVFDRSVNDAPELHSQLIGSVSPEREQAIIKALSVPSKERWQTAAEFKAALYGNEAAPKMYSEQRENYSPQIDVVPRTFQPQVAAQMSYDPQNQVFPSDMNAVNVNYPGYIPQGSQNAVPVQQYFQLEQNNIPPVKNKKRKGIAVAASVLGGAAAVALIAAAVMLVFNSGNGKPEVTSAEETAAAAETENAASTEGTLVTIPAVSSPEETTDIETTASGENTDETTKGVIKPIFSDTDERPVITIDPIKSNYEYKVENNGITITKYKGSDKEVIIPSMIDDLPVKQIRGSSKDGKGISIFENPDSVRKIVLPEGLEIIGLAAFCECPDLEEINIPESVTEISNAAFATNSSLTSIVIPSSVKYIKYGAFQHCSRLESVVLSDSLLSIDECAFVKCSSLKTITIPKSVRSIGKNAFNGCESLKSVVLNEGLEYIYDYAFWQCNDLESIIIPKSVRYIYNGVFENCSSLANVTLSEGLLYIGEYAFLRCYSLVSITIPQSVKEMKKGAFYDCTGLAYVTIINGLSSISEYAFYRCNKLTSVVIPNSVREIKEYAFAECAGLKKVSIPNGCVVSGTAFDKSYPEKTYR